ncbi:MAG TPA: tetratricopeptide repeat protein [Anaerolineales bacterium]|nr:tetratricopeptide repeat protein [Anaerolineales bacterium]
MSRRKTIILLGTTLAIVAYSYLDPFHLFDKGAKSPLQDVTRIDGRELADLPPVDQAIRFFQERIKRNPQDAVSYTLLGEMYMRQARETGDVASYQRAEAALREALELLSGYIPARASLAAVLYAQHNFVEALELAGQVYQSDPRSTQALATLGDAYLALGNYQEGEEVYQELLQKNPTPPVLARHAHLAELKGKPEEALQLMQGAAGEALDSGGSKESVAWYLLRLGDLYFNTGRMDEAGEHYEAALRVLDNYYLALAGLGKVRAAQGRYPEAIAFYEQSVAIIPQPDFLAALGDLYTITSQPDKAQRQYETVEFIGQLAAINKVVYNRQLALFYANHDRKLNESLDLAQKELAVRKDIYAYDTLAWALHKNGRNAEAAEAMEQALKLGTRDAPLYYHAGMIYKASGDYARAQTMLSEALAINPHFDLVQAQIARLTLANIGTD